MSERTTAVLSLSVGDVILDDDGLELVIVGLARNPSGRTVTLTVRYVEADMMPSRPGDMTLRLGISRMVRVP